MALSVYAAMRAGLSPAGEAGGVARWASLALLVAGGAGLYALVGAALGAFRPREVLALLRRSRRA
jgi:hypothetical protein